MFNENLIFFKVPGVIGQIKKSHFCRYFGHCPRVNYQVLKIDGQFPVPSPRGVIFNLFDARPRALLDAVKISIEYTDMIGCCLVSERHITFKPLRVIVGGHESNPDVTFNWVLIRDFSLISTILENLKVGGESVFLSRLKYRVQ